MGAAACKSDKSVQPNPPKNVNKNIIIGVFGLDDAGKTSTVKAIDGDPTDDTTPTIGSFSTMVTNPLTNKNASQQRIKMIDVSGERKYRQKSWSQYYEQIHGLIFVIDASDRRRLEENQDILEDLLIHEHLKDKPILIFANKQDQKNAVKKEQELKRQLNIERLKCKHKIELCSAIPRKTKNKVDDSIRNGFSWLIRTIEENYTTLNARVDKSSKGSSLNRKTNRSENDENEYPYSRGKSTAAVYQSKITSEKLPSITTKKTTSRYNSDDDDDDDDDIITGKNDLNKKKKITGGTYNTTNDRLTKKSNDNEPKPFRATYEPFPEDTPWSLSTSSKLKPTRNDTTLPKLNSKPSSIYDSKRRDVSPLIHDTKTYTTGSSLRRDNRSDDEDDYLKQKSKPVSRFTMNTQKSSYDDDEISRRIITGAKKTYNDDDDDIYPKKTTTTTNLRKTYGDSYENNLHSRSTKSRYDDEDDEDNHRWSSSRTGTTTTKYGKDDYSSSKVTSHTKFEDDDYPTASRSNYNGKTYPKSSSRFDDDDDDDYHHPPSSSKPATRTKYSDDDDDDYYSNSTRKNNYPSSSSYNNNTNRSRSNHDDFFTNKGGSSTNNRFKTNNGYDS